MPFADEFDLETLEAYLVLIFQVARFGGYSPEEIAFIKDALEHTKYPKDRLKHLLSPRPPGELEEAARRLRPLSSAARNIVVREMFYMAYADGPMMDEEFDYIMAMAEALDVPDAVAADIGLWVLNGIEWETEGDLLFGLEGGEDEDEEEDDDARP